MPLIAIVARYETKEDLTQGQPSFLRPFRDINHALALCEELQLRGYAFDFFTLDDAERWKLKGPRKT